MRRRVTVFCVFACLLTVAGQAWSNNRTDDPLGVAVSPQTLILSLDQGGAVTVHTAIPLSTVDTSSLTLNGVPADGAGADSQGNLVAHFNEVDVEAKVNLGSVVLTLEGLL